MNSEPQEWKFIREAEEWKLIRMLKGGRGRKSLWWIQSIPDNGITGAGQTPAAALRDWRKQSRLRYRKV